MKRLVCTFWVVIFITALSFSAAQAADKVVVVPLDTIPFKVQMDEYVRLTGEGIAGSTITAKIMSGPASIDSQCEIVYRKGGKMPIGTSTREFLIKPTGKGTVKVAVLVTSPIPSSPKKEIEYQFEVE